MIRCCILITTLCIVPQAAGRAAAAPPRPNIVVILTDDMGFSDLGCYGGEIATPQLDELAAGGLRFTQFYNTARCCPTRAALLTGLYPHQAGMGHMVGDRPRTDRPPYAGDLNSRSATIAEVLQPAGYRNYMVGKWHLTPFVDGAAPHRQDNWPRQRGFDRFYGTIKGGGSFYDPTALVRDDTVISAYADPEYVPPEGYYYTDAISEHAVRFLDEHAAAHADRPLFMYVAYTAAHWPMHARAADVAQYKGRYAAGYEAIRDQRLARARQLGVVDAAWPLSPPAESWDGVADKAYEERCMEVYAAMVTAMDRGVGRIVGSLRQHGMLDNTLILYLQDNGGCAEQMGRRDDEVAIPRAAAPTLPPLAADYLQPDLVPKQTRDGYPVRQGIGVLPGEADTYCGYGPGWANVSNTPFREYKHWVHEGGVSTPLIAHWPAGIAARGELRREPAHLIDVMATCVDVASAAYPTAQRGEPIQPCEGVSLRPALRGEALARPTPIFFEHEGNRAVRDGRWKLVAKGPRGAWELYDMDADRTELDDLARDEPERVAAMAAQWEAWARRTGVLPWIWKPAYRPGRPAR